MNSHTDALPVAAASNRSRSAFPATARLALLSFLAVLLYASGSLADDVAPWWEAETALGADGSLAVPLTARSWWERAVRLDVGESFVVHSEHSSNGLTRMPVRCCRKGTK